MTLQVPNVATHGQHFAICDEAITRIAGTRSRQCNSMASEIGQGERLKASCLIDMYYKCRGMCANCATVLTEDNIQLDHIIETRYRAARKAYLAGETIDAGKVACIDNVQWLCAMCNEMKERFRARNVNMSEWVNAVKSQSDLGFPIRQSCKHLGTTGARLLRGNMIAQELKENPSITANGMCRLLLGTDAEASCACVTQHMKELGWQSDYRSVESKQKKLATVRALFEQSQIYSSCAQLAQLLNSHSGLDMSYQAWRKHIAEAGVKFNFISSTKWRTQASVGDKQTVLSVLRNAGSQGRAKADILSLCEHRGMNKFLVEQAIEMLMAECAIYSRDSGFSFVAALTRKEAAKQINVSWTRLKKLASEAFSHLNAGPAFMKSSPKALTYYRHEDVEEFRASRQPTAYDLIGASGTKEGGQRGGRPPQQASD